MSDEKRQKWIEERAGELMGLEPDAEMAARPAGAPDAGLIKMAHHNALGTTRLVIQEIRAAGSWDDHARRLQTAILQAHIEMGMEDAIAGLGRSPYVLPIQEIARRAALIEIAVAAGDPDEQILTLHFDAIFGRRAKVAHWMCPNGHSGYALASEMLAYDACPHCGQLLSRYQRAN